MSLELQKRSLTTRNNRKPLDEPERSAFHIRNIDFPSGKYFHTSRPADLQTLSPKIKAPPFPAVTQAALLSIQPCILYVAYACAQKCRSMGICMHYQFVLGCRRCPDGLRCEQCLTAKKDVRILAQRKCPIHQDPLQANPIGNRPEDFLATDIQKQVCDEILQRSMRNEWNNVVVDSTSRPRAAATRAMTQVGDNSSRIEREKTPTNLDDIRRAESVREVESMSGPSSTTSLYSSSSSEMDLDAGNQNSIPWERRSLWQMEMERDG